MRQDSGSIHVGGFDIRREPVAAKRIMGYIPDMPFLYEKLTPVEFLKFIGDLYNVPKATLEPAIERSLKQFGLQEAGAALVGSLSHGMRQRLLYAATLLRDPPVM